MTSSIFTRLNGPCTLAIWSSGAQAWGDGTLGIKVELCPDADSAGRWIEYATFTEDVIEPLDLYGVRLRSRVVRLEDPTKGAGLWSRLRKPAITPDAQPSERDVVLHVAVRGPIGSPSERWCVNYPNPEGAIQAWSSARRAA